ncbi:hypothetical protein QZN08_27135 [Burkholderia multivorans]|nr:hypothetical protein [Burkholderia multivorans]
MSTYFAVVNLDKKERGLMAVVVPTSQIEQEIKEWEHKHDCAWADELCSPSGYEFHEELGWIKPSRGYLNWNSKVEAGIIFMEACSHAWDYKGNWFGDRVIVICDGSETNAENGIDFHEMAEWTPRYFPISLEDMQALIK